MQCCNYVVGFLFEAKCRLRLWHIINVKQKKNARNNFHLCVSWRRLRRRQHQLIQFSANAGTHRAWFKSWIVPDYNNNNNDRNSQHQPATTTAAATRFQKESNWQTIYFAAALMYFLDIFTKRLPLQMLIVLWRAITTTTSNCCCCNEKQFKKRRKTFAKSKLKRFSFFFSDCFDVISFYKFSTYERRRRFAYTAQPFAIGTLIFNSLSLCAMQSLENMVYVVHVYKQVTY